MIEPVIRKRRLMPYVIVLLVGVFFALLFWGLGFAGSGRSFVSKIAAGERPPSPQFTLPVIWSSTATWRGAPSQAVRSGALQVTDLRGHAVVINFWASWCLPCREEAPILARAARTYAGEVLFLAVNVQDVVSDALAFLREFGVPFPSVRDSTNDTFREYGLTGVPETYYLDGTGRVVEHTPGPVTAPTLEAGIARALG